MVGDPYARSCRRVRTARSRTACAFSAAQSTARSLYAFAGVEEDLTTFVRQGCRQVNAADIAPEGGRVSNPLGELGLLGEHAADLPRGQQRDEEQASLRLVLQLRIEPRLPQDCEHQRRKPSYVRNGAGRPAADTALQCLLPPVPPCQLAGLRLAHARGALLEVRWMD